jgi:hypothetical protein
MRPDAEEERDPEQLTLAADVPPGRVLPTPDSTRPVPAARRPPPRRNSWPKRKKATVRNRYGTSAGFHRRNARADRRSVRMIVPADPWRASARAMAFFLTPAMLDSCRCVVVPALAGPMSHRPGMGRAARNCRRGTNGVIRDKKGTVARHASNSEGFGMSTARANDAVTCRVCGHSRDIRAAPASMAGVSGTRSALVLVLERELEFGAVSYRAALV